MEVVLLLGSNLGDSKRIVLNALLKLEGVLGKYDAISAIYETAAWGIEDQANYVNLAVKYYAKVNPIDLLYRTQSIENAAGPCVKTQKYGPRYLDIDILFMGSEIIDSPELVVPHPRLHLRNFVLQPLMDINPAFFHPQLKRTIEELYYACTDTLAYRKISLY